VLKEGLGIQPEQPIPETKAKLSKSIPKSSIAHRIA
jgi:hypothetical protein